MKIFVILLLISQAYSALAGTNLLDLLKAGKAKYATSSCQTFIQSSNHQSLQSDDLKKLTIKAKNSRFVDDYYFHYTNAAILLQTLKSNNPDRVAAQKEILRDGGYKSILEYQMTYSDALSNVAGVGFYIAANPFSSQAYGSYQLALKVDSNAVFFDKVKYAAQYRTIQAALGAKNPGLASCDDDLQLSLIMNENAIDMVYYDEDSEWLVIFNEDIFTQSRFTNIGTASHSAIMSSLVKNGDGAAIIEYITDLKLNKNYAKITLAEFFKLLPAGAAVGGQPMIVKLAESLKSAWSDNLKDIFARLVASKSGNELLGLMADLSNSGLVPQSTYLDISLSGTSLDFMKWIGTRIKVIPQEAKNWKSLYRENISELFKKGLVDLDFVISNAPAEFDKARFFKDYNSLGSKSAVTSIIHYMLDNEPATFKAMDNESKYTIFNDFMKNADIADIPSFTTTMENLGYDTLSSFNYVTRKSSQFGANGIAFVAAYIKLKQNPALLTDPVMNLFLSVKGVDTDFMVYLKQNQSTYPAQTAKYTLALIKSADLTSLDALVTPAMSALLTKDEKNEILGIILSNDSTSILVNKFVQTFAYTPSDLTKSLSIAGASIKDSAAIEAIKVIKSDSSAWGSFTDIKNQESILPLLKLDKTHSRLHSYLIDNATDSLLLNPDQLPDLNDAAMTTLLQSSRLKPYFSSYNDSQKLAMAIRVRKFNPNEAKEYMAAVSYSPEMVQTNFASLMNYNQATDLEDLLNNPSFVAALSDADFQALVKKITAFKNEINMRTLIRSDVLTFNKSLILALSIEKHHGSDNLDEILDHQLKIEDLSASEKSLYLDKFITVFNRSSQLSRNVMWPLLFKDAPQSKKDLLIVNFTKMTHLQQNDFLSAYSQSPELIKKGIALFKLSSLNYLTEVLDHDRSETVAPVLKFIEDNYPLQEDYALHMIKTYDQGKASASAQLPHLQNFICKKVKKWYAFDEILDSCQDKEEKKFLKERRKLICL